jgi:hypothetical protein
VGKVPKHFAIHKRSEFHAFGLDPDIHLMKPFEGQQDFINFLGVPEDRIPSNPPTAASHQFTSSEFVEAANAMAKSMRDRCECFLPYPWLFSR